MLFDQWSFFVHADLEQLTRDIFRSFHMYAEIKFF